MVTDAGRNKIDDARGLRPWLERIRAKLLSPKPISLYLFLLILVTVVPAIAVSVVLLQRQNEAQREIVTTLTEAAAGTIAEAVDRELSGMVTTLRVLSTTPSLIDGDLEQFYDRAQKALAGTGSYFIVLDENHRQLLNTRVPYGSRLGPISDPQSADRALKMRSAVISGAFYGKTARKWVFNAILPVFRSDGPPLLLVMTRNAEDLTTTLSEQNLRGGWNASIVDPIGRVVSSSFMSADVGKPFFLWPMRPGWQRSAGKVSEESRAEDYEAIVSPSGYSGWNVVVWASRATVEEPMRQSLRTLVIGTLIVIAIAAAAAWLLGRQIARPVRRLARDARRLGAGEPVEPVAYPITEVATVSSALAKAATDRNQAENDIRLLMREVAHRAKNQLTVVASIAKQSARNARTFAAFQDSFQKRLHGLARSTDLLIAGAGAGVELRELLEAQIGPFRPDDPKRLELSGPEFKLGSQAAQTIGLAVHELATNASKYGAFAVASGQLSLSWEIREDKLELMWREYVPRLRRRVEKRGFGTEIIERMLGGTLDAEIERTFHRDGLACFFRIPVAGLVPTTTETKNY